MKKIKILFVLIVAIILGNQLLAQINYLEYKSKNNLSCVLPDSTSVMESKHSLDSLSAFEITDGLREFYYDYGMTYYMCYAFWKKPEYMQKSTEMYTKCWEEFKLSSSVWNLMFNHMFIGDCDKAEEYLDLYLEHVEDTEEIVDYQQIGLIKKRCGF